MYYQVHNIPYQYQVFYFLSPSIPDISKELMRLGIGADMVINIVPPFNPSQQFTVFYRIKRTDEHNIIIDENNLKKVVEEIISKKKSIKEKIISWLRS